MPADTANKAKMDAAVARWISEAQNRFDGPTLLDKKAAWVGRQLAALARSARRDEDAPEHLQGLDAVDLTEAQGALLVAADAQRAERKRRYEEQRAQVAADQAARAQRVAA